MSRQASQMAPEPRRSGSDSPILQVDLAGSEDVVVNILNSCVQFLDAILSVVISFSMRSWLYTLVEVWSYHPRCELLSSESKADKLTVVNGKKAPRGSFKQHMKFTFDRSQPTIRQTVSLSDNEIRTYAFLGEQIITCPHHDAWEKKLSLEHRLDGNYMLFYCRAGDTMPDSGISEIAHLPRDRPTFAFLNDFFDQGIKARKEENRVQKENEERDREQEN
ncbi:hypothetical protein V3481_004009 [Fusarium oxysporum f. sp. vasinfectum]